MERRAQSCRHALTGLSDRPYVGPPDRACFERSCPSHDNALITMRLRSAALLFESFFSLSSLKRFSHTAVCDDILASFASSPCTVRRVTGNPP